MLEPGQEPGGRPHWGIRAGLQEACLMISASSSNTKGLTVAAPFDMLWLTSASSTLAALATARPEACFYPHARRECLPLHAWQGKSNTQGPVQHLGLGSCIALARALGRRRRGPRAALARLAQAGKHRVCGPFLCHSAGCSSKATAFKPCSVLTAELHCNPASSPATTKHSVRATACMPDS